MLKTGDDISKTTCGGILTIEARAEKPQVDSLYELVSNKGFPKENPVTKRRVLDVGGKKASRAGELYPAPPSETAL